MTALRPQRFIGPAPEMAARDRVRIRRLGDVAYWYRAPTP